MEHLKEEELTLPTPYSQVRLARRAERSARRVAVLLGVVAVAFAAHGLAFSTYPGAWLLLAALQAVVAWRLPSRGLPAVAVAALEVVLGIVLPLFALALAGMGKPGFGTPAAIGVSVVTLAAALAVTPATITLLRDQDLREAYVRLE